MGWADWAEAEVARWEGATLADGARVREAVFAEIVVAAERTERLGSAPVP